MRRLPTGFYREFHELREGYGKTEYDVDKLLEEALPILQRHLGVDAGLILQRDALRAINEAIEARENDPLQGDFFAHNAHTPLGKRRRIRRGRMTHDQAFRRKLVIDDNHGRQNAAWAVETRWLNETMAALRDTPNKVREDVLNEDGTVKVLELEPEPA